MQIDMATVALSGHDIEKFNVLLKHNEGISRSGMIRKLIQAEYRRVMKLKKKTGDEEE